jgi:hypothetical protein
MGAVIGALLALAAGFGTTAFAQGLPGVRPSDFLETSKGAILLLPPEVVAIGQVASFKWSSDGSKLACLVMRLKLTPEKIQKLIKEYSPPEGAEQAIVVWDAATRKSREVLTMPLASRRIEEFDWIGPSGTLLVAYSESAPSPVDPKAVIQIQSVVTINSPTGATRLQFRSGADGDYVHSLVSPKLPLAALFFSKTGPGAPLGIAQLSIVDGNGQSRQAAIPIRDLHPVGMWSTDGMSCYLVRTTAGQPQPAKREYYLMDLRSATFRTTEPPQTQTMYEQPETTLRVSVSRLPGATSAFGAQSVMMNLIDKTKDEKAMQQIFVGVGVGSQAEEQVSPDEKHVVYAVDGALMLRSTVAVPKEVLVAARAAAKRTEALSNAKQMGLAMLMFAADADDLLPDPSSWAKSIEPYVKDAGIVGSFNYTYNGPRDISKVESPAETVLGYVESEGGRAVVYIDGHAKWIADPPKK